MDHCQGDDDYVLGRDISDSIRLDAQHLLWKLHNRYTLHPAIPKSDHMKIAEVGTGTGIWLFDLAQDLPDTVCLHGYDISPRQFPSKKLWTSNIKLSLMDSLRDPPEALHGKYDVVHLRMWASNLRTRDVKLVIRSASKLLKARGYLQWEEANLLNQDVRSLAGKDFEAQVNKLFVSAGLDYSWVTHLSSSLSSSGMTIIEHKEHPFAPGLIQIGTNTYLMALKEILAGIKRTGSCTDHTLLQTCEEGLDKLITSRTDGLVYNWGPVSLLAQKPHAAQM
ncbi:Methyltransf-12 domain-containing protein [Fusarium falciforme]|uniref:Methyltransf-12 domain-containing protein n=1 Tax=Fusarium falciforme TaxID=195108 RepID=UPI0023001583|nr:Methyltransf-12 domain-containing protein [Fusarium falciforme]WAO96185.1 Methyltransf-12 domain-containing protein [Fusarium falciforme]